MATARQHHYIPQFYLRGFTNSRSKSGKLVVLDAIRRAHYETAVKNVGVERDFNRVEVPGIAPDALETAYAGFEGETARSLQGIEANLKFEGDESIYALNLAALLAVRHPLMRKQWGDFRAEVARKMLSMVLAEKSRWEATVKRMREAGDPVDESLTYEELKRSWETDGYEISIDRGEHIRTETKVFDTVLRTMVDRKWVMIVADEETGPFVTSDRPVTLMWHKPLEMPAIMRDSPGYGMTNTEVIFPLSQRLALVGNFDGNEGTVHGTRELVATVNSTVIAHARQVFAPKLSFAHLDPRTGDISTGDKLLAWVNQRPEAARAG